jgi:DNA mismatch repair protein MutL
LLVSTKNSGAAAQPSVAPENERLPLKAIASSSRGLLLAEGPNGLYLVDQHRAHERLIYNRFRIQHEWDNVVREQLVEPIVLELPPSQAQRLSSRIGELVEAGFECEQFGGRSFIVRTAPDELLSEAIADALSESLTADDETWLDRLLIGLACRSAVRKGAVLPSVEQEALIEGLCATESPTACPHGSPILLHFDDAFLRRQFGW